MYPTRHTDERIAAFILGVVAAFVAALLVFHVVPSLDALAASPAFVAWRRVPRNATRRLRFWRAVIAFLERRRFPRRVPVFVYRRYVNALYRKETACKSRIVFDRIGDAFVILHRPEPTEPADTYGLPWISDTPTA